MAVEFNTNEYQFSHGRAPRGRGAWAFSFKRNPSMDEIVWVNGTYAEAKAAAAVVARARGESTVYVCP